MERLARRFAVALGRSRACGSIWRRDGFGAVQLPPCPTFTNAWSSARASKRQSAASMAGRRLRRRRTVRKCKRVHLPRWPRNTHPTALGDDRMKATSASSECRQWEVKNWRSSGILLAKTTPAPWCAACVSAPGGSTGCVQNTDRVAPGGRGRPVSTCGRVRAAVGPPAVAGDPIEQAWGDRGLGPDRCGVREMIPCLLFCVAARQAQGVRHRLGAGARRISWARRAGSRAK